MNIVRGVLDENHELHLRVWELESENETWKAEALRSSRERKKADDAERDDAEGSSSESSALVDRHNKKGRVVAKGKYVIVQLPNDLSPSKTRANRSISSAMQVLEMTKMEFPKITLLKQRSVKRFLDLALAKSRTPLHGKPRGLHSWIQGDDDLYSLHDQYNIDDRLYRFQVPRGYIGGY
ncbi:hypothetical protein ACFE04_022795 [Oxalis oulophora]